MTQPLKNQERAAVLSQFASDNTSGICPEALEAILEANAQFATPYGEDPWTARASDLFRDLFQMPCEVFFCFNGTAANSMAISHTLRSYHGIIAHPAAHIENDECGGPEFFSHGAKLLLGAGENGKLSPTSVDEVCHRRTDLHFPKARLLSLTQSTELGTVYTEDELAALREKAEANHLSVHMDGARFSNAIAELKVPPKRLIEAGGIDVLCFGGTKNGMPVGEAVIFFNSDLAREFDFRCKQAGQLASKMRFLAAPWVKLLENGAWLRHAQNANSQAARLAKELMAIRGFRLLRPQQANSAYFEVEPQILRELRNRGLTAYDFIGGGVRFMCSWQTTEQDIFLLRDEALQAAERCLPR